MPPLMPPCPEGCGERLKKPGHKTCGSRSCQNKRYRRLKRAQREGGSQSPYSPELQDIQNEAKRDAKAVGAEVARELLRPIVAEALTPDVLLGLQGMVKLVPGAIEALQKDIQHGDAVTRQRAYELVLRYTLGHKSIAPPPADQQPSPMTVVLNVPASGADVEVAAATPPILPELDAESEATEIRDCAECHLPKTEEEFVAGSDRCQACHDEVAARVAARFAR